MHRFTKARFCLAVPVRLCPTASVLSRSVLAA